MNFVFRTDASLLIGTGHVMRCLTLADALRAKGAECEFICREHSGNLLEHIRSKGYPVHALPPPVTADEGQKPDEAIKNATAVAHSVWLGATQKQDVTQCSALLGDRTPDWLIVDHYALDAYWERALRPQCRRLMVIDDLADRPHQCDLLLDQTYGRSCADYKSRVSNEPILLCGSQYALLRPDFAALRPYSLKRRERSQMQHLLITMGGVDKDNTTGQVLQALTSSELPADCLITVVLGATAPWLPEVRQLAARLPWPTAVRVGVDDMAQLMANSDLAIGAAGATSWERCCLGLPTVMVVQASNQRKVAQELELAGAVLVLQNPDGISDQLPFLLNRLLSMPSLQTEMCHAAARVTDGLGTSKVAHYLGC